MHRLHGPVETAHFRVTGRGVEPRLDRLPLDNDLTDVIVAELAPLGLVADPAEFERLFVATVEAVPPAPALAWAAFYRNTLRRLALDEPGSEPSRESGTVAVFRRIYAQALPLVAGDVVLDVGSCFGFFPLLLAGRPDRARLVVATDVVPGQVALAAAAAPSTEVRFAAADAERLPFADRSVDTVTAIHLLEHLPPERGARALAESLRVARMRVLVAVPLEAVPDPAFGHVRAFTLPDLEDVGAGSGWCSRVWEADGGWLQLDRPPGTCPPPTERSGPGAPRSVGCAGSAATAASPHARRRSVFQEGSNGRTR